MVIHVEEMSYGTSYHFSRFTIINTYWAFMKEPEFESKI
jgi:hypothetical protein